MATDPPPAGSATPVPTTEREQPLPDNASSTVTSDQWQGMFNTLSAIYDFRLEDGHDPSGVFHKKVNRRLVPDYYDVIREPIALSTVKTKLNRKEYKDFAEFVRDFALICHNAQVYNRPDAGAYKDGLRVKRLLEEQLQKLVVAEAITLEQATLPYLGEIPPQEDPPPKTEGDGDEEEEDDDDDDDDNEGEESDDSRDKPRRRRGRPRKSDAVRREPLSKEDAAKLADADARKKRGRPPRLDTPMEARIKNVAKGLRRFKNAAGQYKIGHFERLPDRAVMPEYFNEIKSPMAMDVIKRKMKRKKYQSLAQFMADLDLMFDNAKRYNEDESQIYKDAVDMQTEAKKLAEAEMQKADTDFPMEDGRLPLPNGILTDNGDLWKVGDWVHVQNSNDLTKPIPAQIYRTWQDPAGNKFINACWYYRPEQTVHRYERHFYENEIVKTGQYRDHSVDEIVDRCFVMFITRYPKGRPRGLPNDKEIYVCESRYNEEKHTFNKIKTWASCLPDEVRDKDYEMELFPEPRRMKKLQSSIAYLLREEQKETDDLPKPQWGADNAPPKIGAVHRRPRDLKDSPPPDPTPTPPPVQPTPPPPPPPRPQSRQPQDMKSPASNGQPARQPNQHALNAASRPHLAATPETTSGSQARPFQPQASPAIPARPTSNQAASYSSHAPRAAYPSRGQQQTPSQYAANSSRYGGSIPQHGTNYQAPPSIEVYTLNEAGNAAIPPDIREQFHRDELGRVLFFTAPPLDVVAPLKDGKSLGHSVRYLAAKAKREQSINEKRKREESMDSEDTDHQQKAARHLSDAYSRRWSELTQRASSQWEGLLTQATEAEYQILYGDQWEKKLHDWVRHSGGIPTVDGAGT